MASDREFCRAMLPRVSRTFALCIRLLPPELEYAVLVSYLLCRIADTVEDTPDLGATDKQAFLNALSRSLEEEGENPLQLQRFFARSRNDEETLAARANVVLDEFRRLPADRRQRIRPWVQEMCKGMGRFALKYNGDHTAPIRGLQSVSELDEYCYYVAGTVGHLLTDLYPLAPPGISVDRHGSLKRRATSFGLGLQLTNIIKDVADDRRRGWIYIPEDWCRDAGIGPAQLLDPKASDAAQTVMNRLIVKAQAHLLDALEYCTVLPRAQYRIRLFCLTALFFAVRTLRLARRDPKLLDPAHKVKITRPQVYRTLAAASCVAPSNGLIRMYFRGLSGRTS
jgi:farnesyl-diphosphate farnesyltransferase